ncbi:phosphonoacetaldehyde reductase [Candidatus Pacearchaeota archaeon]|nr:phosphonoacetaldehyde reductase [Candidatus Pacearchaeota archaeon]
MNQKSYIGPDSIKHLPKLLAEFGGKNIFLVTGKKSFSASGAKALLDDILNGYNVRRFCDFSENPKAEDVNHGISQYESEQFDIVIAVGGGSSIDVAKLINYLSVHPEDFENYKFPYPPSKDSVKPLIAIPTTSGSGSEATSFAVLYANKEKFSVDNKFLLPDIAIVDPNLTESLPKYITATTGMDALSQAIESYWSINSTNESKRYAGDAIKIIIASLEATVNNPSQSSRLAMAQAAYLAGKAINITRTTAPHAISYPLTSFFGIPHGQAVAVTLSSMLLFNANVSSQDVSDKRGFEYVRKSIAELCQFLGTDSVDNAKEILDSLMLDIGLQTRLRKLGLKNQKDIDIIVANGFNPARVKNNPRMLDGKDLREILEQLL